jgi:hypothetical protein
VGILIYQNLHERLYISWVTLDDDTLSIFRLNEDIYYEQAKVLIWVID